MTKSLAADIPRVRVPAWPLRQRLGMIFFIALTLGSILYWDFYVATVQVENRSDTPISGMRVTLGGSLLFAGALAPHQVRTFRGQAVVNRPVVVSFYGAERNFGYVDPWLPAERHVVDIMSASDVRYHVCWNSILATTFSILFDRKTSAAAELRCPQRTPDT